ncbi:Protein POLLEN DEFECTIVE IN GUIDANCE 1 [Zea mays]|uniref:Protein POLLEN DEFECTIVE IN GUIDANCE 1 n=1 Tax=Zea mays TaxID=4577 RepID=A0A1D6HKC9_MAIZE|nr:Protein POLLEN DEFECTIVE IN GUIDANCE 1 [Zea mays]
MVGEIHGPLAMRPHVSHSRSSPHDPMKAKGAPKALWQAGICRSGGRGLRGAQSCLWGGDNEAARLKVQDDEQQQRRRRRRPWFRHGSGSAGCAIGIKTKGVTMTALLAKATATALLQHPMSTWESAAAAAAVADVAAMAWRPVANGGMKKKLI